MRAPTVTVLASVHNGRATVRSMIDSILAQTFDDFELLVIDDASTDGSVDVLRQRAKGDSRIRVLVNQKNLGLAASLNRGLQAARGPLIARIDADDEAVPHRLERQVAFLRDHPGVDVVGGWINVREGDAITGVRTVPREHAAIIRLLYSCPVYHPTVMYRRDRILELGGYDPRLRRRQDVDLWFRAAHHGLRFANIPEPLTTYASRDLFERNTLSGALTHVRVAYRGLRLVGGGPTTYLAALLPLARFLVPRPMRGLVARYSSRLDPRERAS